MSIAIVIINGLSYGGWLEVEVRRSLGEAAGSFSLEVTEQIGAGLPFAGFPRIREGDSCEVWLDGVKAITGYVDTYQPSYDKEMHGVSIAGRSKTADLVDSSAVETGGQYRNYPLSAILKALTRRFDVEVEMRAPDGPPFADFQIEPGETVWEIADRLAHMRGALAHDDAEGRLVVERIEPGGPVGSLIEGHNILRASATWRADQRHSEIHVRGQRPATDEAWGADAARMKAVARDANITRHRPLLVFAEEPGDDQDMRARADWEATRRAGESVEADVTTTGWTVSPGRLWEPGDAVQVTSPMLALNRALIAETVTYRQSRDEGTLTELRLVPPEAVDPAPAGGGGGGGAAAATGGGASGEPVSDDAWLNVKPTEPAR